MVHNNYGINFNLTKIKWFSDGMHENYNNISFKLSNVASDNERHNISYQLVKPMMERNVLVVDVNNRIIKYCNSAYIFFLMIYRSQL